MPRMYMAVQMEDRFPLVDILQQTSTSPRARSGQLFLRNHDEPDRRWSPTRNATTCTGCSPPTIGRVSTWASAAGWRRCWTTTGARSNSSTARCCRCRGTPIIYYGDEIGMGDNIYLGDRDGVRTPMQ